MVLQQNARTLIGGFHEKCYSLTLVAIQSAAKEAIFFGAILGSVGREITQSRAYKQACLAPLKPIKKPWLCNHSLGRISKDKPCQIMQKPHLLKVRLLQSNYLQERCYQHMAYNNSINYLYYS
jgi:hypothetical protein